MTIWFDVEDLIRYFQSTSRPTGIQRLNLETCRAVWQQAGSTGEIGFCRRGARQGSFKNIHFPALEAGILALANAPAPCAPNPSPTRRATSGLARTARRLPPRFRLPLGAMARAGTQAMTATRDLARATTGLRPGGAMARRIGGHQFDLHGPDVVFGRGDWFVNLGASWDNPYAPDFLTFLRNRGTRIALMAHDMIPDLFPEWCAQKTAEDFSAWLEQIVPRTDLMFTISQNTANDLITCLRKRGGQAGTTVVLPVGSHKREELPDPPALLDRPYVLVVGTIEARKNHGTLVRVWRRMLQTMPEDMVPDLVFAGKTGRLTGDLFQQLGNTGWLGGKIRLVESPSESCLARLYRHCLFTAFPSFYEGWGLPVTESLSHGKTVAASNHAAIAEAGGNFCAYFDPDNTTDAYNVIRGLIENPSLVAALQARIAAEYIPPSWDDTAAALLTRLGLEERDFRLLAARLQSIN